MSVPSRRRMACRASASSGPLRWQIGWCRRLLPTARWHARRVGVAVNREPGQGGLRLGCEKKAGWQADRIHSLQVNKFRQYGRSFPSRWVPGLLLTAKSAGRIPVLCSRPNGIGRSRVLFAGMRKGGGGGGLRLLLINESYPCLFFFLFQGRRLTSPWPLTSQLPTVSLLVNTHLEDCAAGEHSIDCWQAGVTPCAVEVQRWNFSSVEFLKKKLKNHGFTPHREKYFLHSWSSYHTANEKPKFTISRNSNIA